jgi:hypothetical protein
MNRMPKSLGGRAGSASFARALGASVLAAWVALVSGCGGGGGTPVTEDSYCEQKAEKECQVSATCVSTLAACVTQRKTACLAVNAGSKTAPRIFTTGNVGPCIDKTNSVYAKTLSSGATQADLDAMVDVCAYVFQGNSTAACTVKYDCKDKGQICDKGICVKQMNVSKGSFCVSPGQVCSADSYCANDTATSMLKCLPKAVQSAPCSASLPCIDPYRCDSVSLTCVPKLGQGELCGSSADCSATVSFCDQYAGCKCDPGLKFAGGASACVDYGGGPSVTPACGAGSSPDAGTTSNTDASSGG